MVGKTLSHYEILAPLGAGGMGEVYRARDTKLERDVAIKVLPDDLAADPDRLARFEREAKLLAALSHANIGAIYGLEEDDGHRYLILELIEGESLERRLQRGPIPVAEALDIARQIAEALEAAHDAGIIHRDVKPANVLLTAKGGVKVLDFGIAKSTEVDGNAAATAQATSLTHDGALMGTPPYMSPEQIRGQEADQRADIWAFGCVVYEMLVGSGPFQRETVADTLVAILETEPDGEALPADVPAAVPSLLGRCLQKDPRRRLHHIADARIELYEALHPQSTSPINVRAARRPRRLGMAFAVAAAGVVISLVAFDIGGVRTSSLGAAGSDVIDSVAVLPFDNFSDPERDFFADGMTDELIARLQMLASLRRVTPFTSVKLYKDDPERLRVVGEELGVEALVAGTVRENGDRLTIELRLFRAATEDLLWTDSFELPVSEALALQNTLALEVAQQLGVDVTAEEQLRLTVARSADPRAIDAYLRGQELVALRTPDALRASIPHFEDAVRSEADFAPALAGLAMTYSSLVNNLFDPPEELPLLALSYAEEALAADATQVEALHALAWYRIAQEWDWETGLGAARLAVELRPASPLAHKALGQLLVYRGDYDAGVAELRRAVELDPTSSLMQRFLGEGLALAGQLEASAALFQGIVDREPNNALAWKFGTLTHFLAGDAEATRLWAERASELVPGEPFYIAGLAMAAALEGDFGEARAIGEQLEEMSVERYVDPGMIASLYATIDDPDAALHWLEMAYERRTGYMVHISDHWYPALVGNQRFEEMQTEVGFLF